MESNSNFLTSFGWDESYESLNTPPPPGARVGRVASIQGFKYHLVTETGETVAELAGRLLYGTEPSDLPKTGDFVYFLDYGTEGYIVSVIPRRNALTRKNPGEKSERQVLVANIDRAFVVQALDRDFNLARLDRYLSQIAGCQIAATVVLNKVDLVGDPNPAIAEVEALGHRVPVIACSSVTGIGMDQLATQMSSRRTYVFVGSSGVGKSSLTNALLQSDMQRTQGLIAWNGKGRHTTTVRDLFQLPNGALLIDTPGMREFGMTVESRDTGVSFPKISEFATQCRYADCTHLQEQGCAVLSALQNGTLELEAYERYVKLFKEQQRFLIRAEDKKRMNRQFGKLTKEAKAYRKKNKY